MATLQQNRYFGGIVFSVFLLSYILSNKNPVNFLGNVFTILLLILFGSKAYTGLYTNWVGPWLSQYVNPRSLGSWAVISGATDGIGLEYCRQLAGLGMNIVLVSRSKDKLKKVAKELEERYKVRTQTIVVDFSLGPETYFESLKKELGKIRDIGILVNNVGICYEKPQQFDSPDLSLGFMKDIINVNIFAALTLTKVVLPGMVENNKGAVINVGSITSFIGLPFYSLYSSSKSFIERFTLDLSREYVTTNILFQYQYPSYITSKMSSFSKPTVFVPNPKSYVQQALKSIGIQSSSAIWPWHRIVVPVIQGYDFLMPGLCEEVTKYYTKCFWIGYLKKKMLKERKGIESQVKGVDN